MRHEAKSRAAITPSRSCAGSSPASRSKISAGRMRRTSRCRVDAIDERSAYAVLVAPDLGHRAGALPPRRRIPAGTRVAGRHEHEPRPGRSRCRRRVSITDPLSMGWRMPCKTELLNSASSSRKRTPWWARDTSPGRRGLPPLRARPTWRCDAMAEGALARDDGIDGLGGLE